MPKVWKFAHHYSDNLIEQLLYNRGIKKTEEKEFFNPDFSDYQKELQIPGIAAAKKRILQSVKNQELVVVYGDYDVDGVCGAAVLYYGLTSLGAKVLPYIPHREREGYGLSKDGLQIAKDKGAGLVITVDNGIVALEQAKFAQDLGLDLIITDHHLPLKIKPECLSIVHSTKMCGTAVAWCLIKELISEKEAFELLDLVAISTVADMMPLLGLNRALVKMGLEVLNKTKKAGLLALLRQSKIPLGEVTSYHIGHILAPRINAIGRLEHAIDALRLLCTKDSVKARNLAQLLSDKNDQKKKLTLEAITEAKEVVSLDGFEVNNKKVLILDSKSWIPGIIGLVAARICEEYRLPTVVIAQGEVQSKGSARSVNGLNIIESIRQCSDLLIDVGGHAKAAGFTIETSRIADFKVKLSQLLQSENFDQTEVFFIEAEVSSTKLNKKLIEEINRLEPTGEGNPKPVLASKGLRVSDLRDVGEGKHLKFKADGIDAIAFSFGDWAKILQEGQLVDLAYFLEINSFNGNDRLQLKVLDISP